MVELYGSEVWEIISIQVLSEGIHMDKMFQENIINLFDRE